MSATIKTKHINENIDVVISLTCDLCDKTTEIDSIKNIDTENVDVYMFGYHIFAEGYNGYKGKALYREDFERLICDDCKENFKKQILAHLNKELSVYRDKLSPLEKEMSKLIIIEVYDH